MSVEAVRRICRALPAVTEDIKWGSDLVFSVGGKMFKCTPEMFAELTERDGIIPAPYLARAMWVRERSAGEVLERRELTDLIKTSYELVVATLPKSKRPGAAQKAPKALKRPKKKPARTDRSGRGR
jgi:predicted DNA-binding protein (MmcQ/YjbR family)